LKPGQRAEVKGTDLVVDPVLMEHREESLGYRFERAGKAAAFTGDTAWTPNLRTLAKGAEVLVTDCTYFDEDYGGHLSYQVIRQHAAELEARRIVLSHLGPRVRANLLELEHPYATDDLVLEI
jgi:ribonuclease BN (tRNA processing enzyme)